MMSPSNVCYLLSNTHRRDLKLLYLQYKDVKTIKNVGHYLCEKQQGQQEVAEDAFSEATLVENTAAQKTRVRGLERT